MIPNPNATQASDRVMATDCLETLKHKSAAYSKAAIDSSSPSLRRSFLNIHRDVVDCAEKVFRVMETKQWYQVQAADRQQVSDAYSRFAGGAAQGQRTY